MSAHMKWFDLQAEPVEKPEGGWVNYPSQLCIDTNPKFRHLLSAQELVILQQAARVKELEEALTRISDGNVMSGKYTHAETLLTYQKIASAALKGTS